MHSQTLRSRTSLWISPEYRCTRRVVLGLSLESGSGDKTLIARKFARREKTKRAAAQRAGGRSAAFSRWISNFSFSATRSASDHQSPQPIAELFALSTLLCGRRCSSAPSKKKEKTTFDGFCITNKRTKILELKIWNERTDSSRRAVNDLLDSLSVPYLKLQPASCEGCGRALYLY